MSEDTELLREIVELLRLIAEPQIEKRDQKLRSELYRIVGKSAVNAKAVSLMDGNRNQVAICREAGIDSGNLSRLMKALRSKQLVAESEKSPKLTIPLPQNFPNRPVEDRDA